MASNDEFETVNVLQGVPFHHREKEKKITPVQKFSAEFLGTAFLVFVVTGIPIFAKIKNELQQFKNQSEYCGNFEGALVLTTMIYVFGRISGAHFNPAVTIPMYLRKNIDGIECLYYIFAQILGGVFGSILVLLCSQGVLSDLGPNYYDDFTSWSLVSIFSCEFILTFILVSVIFASNVKQNNFGNLNGLIIGITLYFLGITGNNVSGPGLNPARSIGPAIIMAFSGNINPMKQIWLYILAPIFGGITASQVALLFE